MLSGKGRTFVASAFLGLALCSQLSAGPIADAVGKGWDKAMGKVTKAVDAAKARKQQGAGGLKGLIKKAHGGAPGGGSGGGCPRCR